uniref:Uncharacterized protein n=1 Tax=Lotus japonicus TaxID=34305 RepID=I3T4A0_LOTJA|nr:unknown [Lotus japonicus]
MLDAITLYEKPLYRGDLLELIQCKQIIVPRQCMLV